MPVAMYVPSTQINTTYVCKLCIYHFILGISTGIIVAIAVGIFLVIAVVFFMIFICSCCALKKKKHRKPNNRYVYS